MARFSVKGDASAAPKNGAATVAATLAASLGARVHIDVVIPRTEVRGKMRLCSRTEEFTAKAQARQTMADAGYPLNGDAHAAPGVTEQWAAEIMAEMLSRAVRDPEDTDKALAAIEEWRDLDDMQLLALWNQYNDLATRLDPVGATNITDEALAAITSAAKKKDADLLMGFGSRLLALFAITSVDRPASSETPTSSSGPSPTA
jgi:hypothetical protein